MGLYERILGTEEPKLPCHQLAGALGELERGFTTIGDVATAFGLSAGEQTELSALLARVVPPLESISLGGFATLTNVGAAFDATNGSRGLGFCFVETFGITGFEFAVGMDRNGAGGTISWQLWDDTNAAQIALIDDTAGAGAKYLTTSQAVGPLASGTRRLRVRCKSTTAADDPIYLGASLTIRRKARQTALELHEVLMLAESGLAYQTPAAIKTRLGV